MNKNKIAIIGCGNIGLSIVKGLLEDETIVPKNIIATKRKLSDITQLKELGVITTSDNIKAIKESNIIILAVKPYNVLEVIDGFKKHLDAKKHILISVATGISIKQIRDIVKIPVPIFRAMPNTAADVKESISCICHDSADTKALESVKHLFDKIGTTIFINEELMEAATIIGACGIAYVLRFIRAMTQGGIQIGFDAKSASNIVNHVVKGAAELLIERNEHPEFEIDKVTTPKGCTIVGLNEMEHNGFSSSLIKGIVASFQKIEKK